MFLSQIHIKENLGNNLGDFIISSLISEANNSGLKLPISNYTQNKDIFSAFTIKEKIHNYILKYGNIIDDQIKNKITNLSKSKEEIKNSHENSCYEQINFYMNKEKEYQEIIQKQLLESKVNEFNEQIQLAEQRYKEKMDNVIKGFTSGLNIAPDMLAIILNSNDFETKFETLRASIIDNENELRVKLNEYYEKYVQQFDENKFRKHQIGELCASYNGFKNKMEEERRLMLSKHLVDMIQVDFKERQKKVNKVDPM